MFIIQSLRATYPAFLWESINANGFRANHTSQDGNHIHERIVSFPDSFTLGKTIDRKSGKDVGERTSSPDVDKDYFFFFGLSISNSKFDFFFHLENLIYYLCLKESVLVPLQTQSYLEQNGLALCSPKQELLATLTLELGECG